MTQEIHDLAQAYAVGALSTDEAAEFSTHLETCRVCRREVAAMLDVTAALSDSVATQPPAGLRASVLAEIARTPQEAAAAVQPDAEISGVPRARGPHEEPGSTAATRPPAHRSGSNVVPLRRSWATGASSLLAAAAVLTAIAFGGLWYQNRNDATDATAQANQLTALLSADDVRTVPGVSHSQSHTGAIVMSRQAGVAIFVASELPDLPNDKVYEAWTIDNSGDPAPAGTFTPQASNSLLTLPAASFKADTMAITVEPAGGSQAPTSDAVVTFVMPQA